MPTFLCLSMPVVAGTTITRVLAIRRVSSWKTKNNLEKKVNKEECPHVSCSCGVSRKGQGSSSNNLQQPHWVILKQVQVP